MQKLSSMPIVRVAGISLGHLAHDLYIGFLPIFIPFLIEKFHISIAMAGLFMVCYRLPTLLSLPLGFVCDRINLLPCLIIAPACTALLISSLGQIDTLVLAYATMVGAGVCSCLYHLVGPVLIGQVSARQTLGRNMGMWMLTGESSRFLSPLLGAFAIGWWGFGRGAWPVIFIGLIYAGVLFVLLRGVSTASKTPRQLPVRAVLKQCLPVILPVSPVILIQGFVGPVMFTYLPAYIVHTGQSIVSGGVALGVFEASGLLGAFIGGMASDKFGRFRLLSVCYAVSGLALLLLPYAHGDWVYPLLAILGFFALMSAPVVMATIMQHIPEPVRGMGNGLYMGLNFSCAALGILLAGIQIEHFGYGATFTVSAFLAFAIILWLSQRRNLVTNLEGK